MKPTDRAVLPQWLPALQVSTVAWAGARASTRGTQLYRDGALARLVVGEREAKQKEAIIKDMSSGNQHTEKNDSILSALMSALRP